MLPGYKATVQALLTAEQSKHWGDETIGTISRMLRETAERFLSQGDAIAREVSERMGVTPGEVWLETIFPSVWGLLSTRRGLLSHGKAKEPLRRLRHFSTDGHRTKFDGGEAIRVLPATMLERVLLPGVSGHVLLKSSAIAAHKSDLQSIEDPAEDGLALCLMPFNLASIGVLDIVHLLCRLQQRVVAKISEKVNFVGPLLERVLAPLIDANALRLVYGGPEVGAWLATQPEFSHIHLTGSARTAAAVAQLAGSAKMTVELGGVTLAIVFPDALETKANRRDVARQIAFGALANNGQHCVSFQVVLVPVSQQAAFERLLRQEFALAVARGGGSGGCRKLVDRAAVERLTALTTELQMQGARLTPRNPRADGEYFPACLIQQVDEKMRLFRDEAFGPVVELLPVPVEDFAANALAIAHSPRLVGDLGISLFTSRPRSAEIQQVAREVRHGIVTINTYPGVAFATSVPWGAGPGGMSGKGWVHNYELLPEREIDKVVLTAPLGRKGLGFIRWEDPWLLNVSGQSTADFAKALVKLTLAYFLKQPLRLVKAQWALLNAVRRREAAARRADRLLAHG